MRSEPTQREVARSSPPADISVGVVGVVGVVIVFGAALIGCPGGIDVPVPDQGSNGDVVWVPIPDGDWTPDDGAAEGYPFPDSGGSDAVPGDGTPDKPLTTTAGGPCPCSSPLLCVASVCRKPCLKQAGNGPGSGCAASEACTSAQGGATACIPAASKGGGLLGRRALRWRAPLPFADPHQPLGELLRHLRQRGDDLLGRRLLLCHEREQLPVLLSLIAVPLRRWIGAVSGGRC